MLIKTYRKESIPTKRMRKLFFFFKNEKILKELIVE